MLPYSTIRHSQCEILVSTKIHHDRCRRCIKYRDTLRKMVHRVNQRQPDELACPNSHTNYQYLEDTEKDQRLHNMHSLYRNTRSKLNRLQLKIAQATSDNGVKLDREMHTDMISVMESSSNEVEKMHPEGSFERIFWEEQRKAVNCKDT